MKLCTKVYLLSDKTNKIMFFFVGMMFVDTMGPFTGESQGVFQGLDLSEMLFIGGVPDFGEIHPSAGFSRGFKGKFHKFAL